MVNIERRELTEKDARLATLFINGVKYAGVFQRNGCPTYCIRAIRRGFYTFDELVCDGDIEEGVAKLLIDTKMAFSKAQKELTDAFNDLYR